MKSRTRTHIDLMDGLLLWPVWMLLLFSIVFFALACTLGLLPSLLFSWQKTLRYWKRLVTAYTSYVLGFSNYLEGEVKK